MHLFNRKRIPRLVQFAAVSGLLALIEPAAFAISYPNDPFGTAASTGVVNRDPTDGSHWINWKNKATGECAYTYLGDGGLSDDYKISGDGGDDSLSVATSNSSFCGYPMTPPNYNGHFLDLWGIGGNDSLVSGTGDTWLVGGEGNDVLISGRGSATLIGESGDDTILQLSNPVGSGGTIGGGSGNDCLSLTTSIAATCDTGTDQWWGPGGISSMPADCETFSASCCPGIVC